MAKEMTSMELAQVLCAETHTRLNHSKTGLDFSGYDTTIPGWIIIPLKVTDSKKQNQEQAEELRSFGYKKVDPRTMEKYNVLRKRYTSKELYYIPIEDLCALHKHKVG